MVYVEYIPSQPFLKPANGTYSAVRVHLLLVRTNIDTSVSAVRGARRVQVRGPPVERDYGVLSVLWNSYSGGPLWRNKK